MENIKATINSNINNSNFQSIINSVFSKLNLDASLLENFVYQFNNELNNINLIGGDVNKEHNNLESYIIEQKIKLLWGNNYAENALLVKRAVSWLELDKPNLEQKGEEEIAVILKLLQLGKLLTEDNNSFNNNISSIALTKQQAISERNKLTTNKEFMDLINNKAKIGHNEALAKLNNLNNIIATQS